MVESMVGRLVGGCDVKPAAPSRNSDSELPPWPYGIATTHSGHVVVSDAAHHCIFVFDADLRLERRFGRRGSRNRQFKSPRHLAINSNNEILVSDYGNHCVKARRALIITLRAKLSGAVYCKSVLSVCGFVAVFVCLWVCYYDNSKLRASILTKLGL